MRFEWDPQKADANVEKHGVTFEEASTAFADWESITVPDPEHSIGEERWYLLGVSERGNLLVVCHTERGESFRIISAWYATGVNGNSMKSSSKKSAKASRATAVPDIDFSGGVRGKYAARYAESTNIVVLSPDVAEVFPNSEAVNEALRTLVRLSGKTVGISTARARKTRRLTSR